MVLYTLADYCYSSLMFLEERNSSISFIPFSAWLNPGIVRDTLDSKDWSTNVATYWVYLLPGRLIDWNKEITIACVTWSSIWTYRVHVFFLKRGAREIKLKKDPRKSDAHAGTPVRTYIVVHMCKQAFNLFWLVPLPLSACCCRCWWKKGENPTKFSHYITSFFSSNGTRPPVSFFVRLERIFFSLSLAFTYE